MGLLDGVKKDTVGKKEAESIVNILPTIKPVNEDEVPEYPFDGNDPDDKIVTDADAKREIAIALHESEKVELPQDSPLLEKTSIKKTPKKAAKKTPKKPPKKKGKKIVLKKKPKDESKMDVKKKPPKKIVKKKEEVTPPDSDTDIPTLNEPAEPVEIVPYVQPDPQVIPVQQAFPSIEELRFMISRRNMLKDELINPETDYMDIKGKKFMLKSGWRKFIEGFRISIDIISVKVYRFGSDVVAEYRVKAVTPFGQFAVADGTKSKSEYWSDKYQSYGSYNLHNLKATARTRAINIAVSDLVGHGEVSAEEAQTNEIIERDPLFKI